MNSFIAWVGGKRILAKTLISLLPEHRTYVEVFGGAGWVLFKKNPSDVEVWNDLNSDLVNLFRVVRNRLDAFKRRQYFLLSSREEYFAFQKAIRTGKFKDDVDRAIAFYYCVRNSFGSGIFTGYAFGPNRGPKYCSGLENLKGARERLKNVYVENLSFDRLIPNYDTKATVFYCDPPYMVTLKPSSKYYQHVLTEDAHTRLRDMLKGISGRFILSYDEHPEVRRLYKRFHVRETAPVVYTMNNRKGVPIKRVRELIITNF